jgi:hypothetical protein
VIAFKIDENLPIEIRELLRVGGFDALTVLDQNLGGRPDTDVAAVCLSEGRVLLTFDLDFGRREERREPSEQLDRGHHAMLRAPAAHVLHPVGDASSREPPKAFERERWARPIAAQTFASKVVACFDPHARVQVEAVALDRERRPCGANSIRVARAHTASISTSRSFAPFEGPTRPRFSIVSTMRAARL